MWLAVWLVGCAVVMEGGATTSLRVLAAFPFEGHSHQAMLQGVVTALLKRGHHVTTVSPVAQSPPHPNHTHIPTPMPTYTWKEVFEFERHIGHSRRAGWQDLDELSDAYMTNLMEAPGFVELTRNSKETFDVVLVEPFFREEELVLLGRRYSAAVVAVSTSVMTASQEHYAGVSRNPAVATGRLTFWQRLYSAADWVAELLEHRLYYVPNKEARWVRLMGDRPGELPLSDALYNIDLHLVNSGPCLHKPIAYSHNIIHVPGLHISKEKSSLPEEWKKRIEAWDAGVIVFTMGSMVPVSKMKPQVRKDLLSAFSRLPYLVIWKSDIDLPDLPPNVKLFKWLPQAGILAHPNCKLLMTHGGLLSKQEALYHGVPTVIIPLFADQPMNAANSEQEGISLTLQYFSMNEHSIYETIMNVTTNDSFRNNLKRCQGVMKEMTHRSEAEVGYWVEHVAKYGGKHLRPERYLYWFQYYLLDVILLLVAGLVLAGILLVKIGHSLANMRFANRDSKTAKKIKKK